ncbi:MAG: redoxin domain-containing protein [Anaerolineales bacterium]|nr:redoxin domain-containing protein [Anaerolineales bacterium]
MSSGQRISLLVGAGLVGLAGLGLWLALLGRGSAPSAPPPTASTAGAAALVEGQAISVADWQRTAALDQVMSTLAGQPPPAAEATLERLINEQLVLQAATAAGFQTSAGAAEAEARLAALQQSWGADAAAVAQALAGAGLARADLLAEVSQLLRVEAYLQQITASQDAAAWLAERRAQAHISVLADLASVSGRPTPEAAAPAPTQAAATVPALAASDLAALPAGPFEGQRAPDFELTTTSGEKVRLSDLRGRPVAVNFWATWCPACRQELPALQAAFLEYEARGAAVLAVDLREDAAAVTAYAAEFGLGFPLLLDADGAVANEYRVVGIPTTVFVDADGVVRARHVGPLTTALFADYLTPLLPSAPTSAAGPETPAPAPLAADFSLPRESGALVSLADYRDKESVVLVFYRGQT